jgi:hypothetical protein
VVDRITATIIREIRCFFERYSNAPKQVVHINDSSISRFLFIMHSVHTQTCCSVSSLLCSSSCCWFTVAYEDCGCSLCSNGVSSCGNEFCVLPLSFTMSVMPTEMSNRPSREEVLRTPANSRDFYRGMVRDHNLFGTSFYGSLLLLS